MSKGYVYVLTNPAMPGYVKIGRTNGDVHARAAQLFSTGVPLPFQVAALFFSPDCAILEAECHKRLEGHRVDTGREFFSVSISQAIDCVKNAHIEQIDEWIGEFLPDHSAFRDDQVPDLSNLAYQAHNIGIRYEQVVEAVSVMSVDCLMPALQKLGFVGNDYGGGSAK